MASGYEEGGRRCCNGRIEARCVSTPADPVRWGVARPSSQLAQDVALPHDDELVVTLLQERMAGGWPFVRSVHWDVSWDAL